jgi:hypothetical protein
MVFMLIISLMIMLVITMIEQVSWARSVEMTLGAAVVGVTLLAWWLFAGVHCLCFCLEIGCCALLIG